MADDHFGFRVLCFLLFSAMGIVAALVAAHHSLTALSAFSVGLIAAGTGMIFGGRWAGWVALVTLPIVGFLACYSALTAELVQVDGVQIADPRSALWAITGGAVLGIPLTLNYFRHF